MIEISFSQKELESVIAGLREREDRMYNDSLGYRGNNNKVAQLDCLNEMKIARTLRERLESLAR